MRAIAVAIWVAGLVWLGGAGGQADPGRTDREGCHVCRTRCEERGDKTGARHCHGPKGNRPAPAPGRAQPVAPSSGTVEQAYVEKVVDGDTLEVRLLYGGQGGEVVRIRVLGIDCPESHQNRKCETDGKNGRKPCAWQVPRGLVAARSAASILKQKVVGLECDGACKQEVFGRLLRYLRLRDGKDFGLVLLQEGLCEDFGWKYRHPRQKEYRNAQDEAKRKRLGIWQ